MIAAGADAKEREHLRIVSVAGSIEGMASQATDGEEVSTVPIAGIAVLIQHEGKKVLDPLGTTSLADAQKDPSFARGRVIKVALPQDLWA
jgi:hypothetical protein